MAIAVVIAVGIIAFLVVRSPRDWPSRVVVAMCGLGVGWQICILVSNTLQVPFMTRVAVVFATQLMPTALLLAYSLTAPTLSRRMRTSIVTLYGVAAVLSALTLFTRLLWDRIDFGPLGEYRETYGPLLFLYFVFSAMCLGGAAVRMLVHARSMLGDDRLRLHWVLLGLGTSFVVGIASSVVLPILGIQALIDWGPVLAPPFFFGCTAVAVVRYRLLGIETIVHKTIAWVVISLGLAIPLGIALALVRPWLDQQGTLAFTMVAIGVFYLFLAYHRWLQPRVDHLFARRRYKAERALREFIEELRELGHMSALSTRIIEFTGQVYPQWASLYLTNARKGLFERVAERGEVRGAETLPIGTSDAWIAFARRGEPILVRSFVREDDAMRQLLRELGAELLVPLSAGGSLVGLIALGPRQTLQPYDGEDQALLRSASSAAAIAVSNALTYDKAVTDPLTGLYNRLLVTEAIERQIKEARRHGEHFGLLMIDLDKFKQINDVHGHLAGDAVLVAVADRLRMSCRSCDLIARLGGDEFVVLVPRLAQPRALDIVVERVGKDIRSGPIQHAGAWLEIGGSVGSACFPQDGADALTLLKAADVSLYRIKAQRKTAALAQSIA
jgi:diguanylate cyclase (GGDEF)-like protein